MIKVLSCTIAVSFTCGVNNAACTFSQVVRFSCEGNVFILSHFFVLIASKFERQWLLCLLNMTIINIIINHTPKLAL